MMHRSFKMMVLPLLSLISFTACSYLPTTSTSPIQQLEQVQNIEALPNTKTNLATLSRSNSGCLIQFTGYFDGGESTETWYFKKNQLKKASSETYQYVVNQNHLAATSKPMVDSKTRRATTFDIQNPDVMNNFNKLKSHFSQNALARCA
jgi:hypothetical protein